MPLEDKQLRLRCLREIARRPIDYSQLQIQAINGIVRMTGVLRPIRGNVVDMDKELRVIIDSLERLPKVKEVVTRDLVVQKR